MITEELKTETEFVLDKTFIYMFGYYDVDDIFF